MTIQTINNFIAGTWVGSGAGARPIVDAVTGEPIAEAGNDNLDFQSILDHAREVGGPNLRAMTFHDRAKMLKAMALYLNERKQPLYDISYSTGATLSDHKIDVDGGIGTVLGIASKGRREMPNSQVYMDGAVEMLGRAGEFVGQHIYTPIDGVAIHINAFNFPVWGMLEKLAPTLMAGMPAIVKPATATCHVTELCFRMIIESGILPEGSVQIVNGSLGDLLDRLEMSDAVSFTGSAETALKIRSKPHILKNSIRFTAEQDSLNASILGPEAKPDTPEFDLFVKEVHREMTAKAGQKCTAIRRIIVPDTEVSAFIEAIGARLAKTTIGDPKLETTDMGALVSANQKKDVLEKAQIIAQEAERVFGDPENFIIEGDHCDKGAFLPPMLFHCANPDTAKNVHETEAFGPVSTIMGYHDLGHAAELANKGKGSLVASVITHDPQTARELAARIGHSHGRLYFNNRDSMNEATGHGSPLPHLVHGGPGRAGGGEELGGVRGILHNMQRTAIQGSPDILSAITDSWVPGSSQSVGLDHPFTRNFGDLEIGETIHTASRQISMEDIEHFAEFTGDNFYAHMDEKAAAANPFFPGRVAHGYLLLSFAAGLFVEPNPGPVLANTGLDNLRFLKPVQAGDTIGVQLTVKSKTERTDSYGEVRWAVLIINQTSEPVAQYELLTMNAF